MQGGASEAPPSEVGLTTVTWFKKGDRKQTDNHCPRNCPSANQIEITLNSDWMCFL